jgi:hypothetical protein
MVLHVDIMFVNEEAFFVSVSTPLGLTIVNNLGRGKGSRNVPTIRKVLFSHVDECKSNSFIVRSIYSDGEGAVSSLRRELSCRHYS